MTAPQRPSDNDSGGLKKDVNPNVERDFERDWRRRFEHFADLFDDDAGIAGWSGSGLDTRLRYFLRAWERMPEARTTNSAWLDAGCGAGTYTRLLAADSRRVTAIDYSIPSVFKARQRVAEKVEARKVEISWAAADVTRLPFASGSFDGILCFGVMQALSAPHAALRELRRVLSNRGVLWVDALNGRCLPAAWQESRRRKEGRPAHLRYDERGEFKRALIDSGFGSVQNYWVPILPKRLRLLQPLATTPIVNGMLNAVPPLAARLAHSMLVRATVQ